MRSFCRTFPAPPISPISHLPYLLLRWCMVDPPYHCNALVVHMQSWNYLQEENIKNGIESTNKWHLSADLKYKDLVENLVYVPTYIVSLSWKICVVLFPKIRRSAKRLNICDRTQILWKLSRFDCQGFTRIFFAFQLARRKCTNHSFCSQWNINLVPFWAGNASKYLWISSQPKQVNQCSGGRMQKNPKTAG